MRFFDRPVAADPALAPLADSATRASRFAQSAVERAADGNVRNAVGDAAEAVRRAQMLLHDALSAARAAEVPWSTLANYAGTTAEYLEPAHQQYDPEARTAVPVTARTGWRPLG